MTPQHILRGNTCITVILDFSPGSGNTTPATNMIISRSTLLAIALAITAAGSDTLPVPPATPQSLAASVRQHLVQDRFARAFWGIKIESLDTGQILFEHHADKLLKPASNAKLFTAALALDRLGPDRRLRTSCFARQLPSRSGTLPGDLYIYGRGDFSFAARFHDGDYSASLAPLVETLKQTGIRRIRGGLVGDATYFNGPPFGAGWTWDDLQHYYGAEVSALTHEDNVVDLFFRPGPKLGSGCSIETRPRTSYLTFVNRTTTASADSTRALQLHIPPGENVVYVTGHLPLGTTNWIDAAPVRNAPLWFVSQLQDQLEQHQIRVGRPPRTVDWLSPPSERPHYGQLVEVATVESPPLSELVRQMMKSSQNLYAQSLFLQVGQHRQSLQNPSPEPPQTTEQAAMAELTAFLAEAGIPAGSVNLDEGSGLSRRALVTPNAIVELLKYMDRHRNADLFRASLPIAGVDGTLSRRMNQTAAQGRVQAKTGTLAHVFALSGYVTTAAGERLVFSLMLNNISPASNAEARSDLDHLAILLASLDERTRPASVDPGTAR
ncbi:MAG: D-alanyl-D-alanine carboxypeptidase/D-alanyl-D-alanine-endopeptidase [Verrucomicrobia bacterium]|nr:D-alanyl-D-alanine carboxypeptidase/D-alanyl-D-alanine-endopeptidase [Verrucomicrobiota bacterium]